MSDKREAIDKRDLYSQMDKAAVRTAADIEQKYNIGKSFAEAIGVAEDSREVAENSKKVAEGTAQEVSEMFTKDILMTGTFQNTAMLYFPPDIQEYMMLSTLLTEEDQAKRDEFKGLFDFNGDGSVNELDKELLGSFLAGEIKELPGFEQYKINTQFEITIDFKKAFGVYVTGKNMWGRQLDFNGGLDITSKERPIYQTCFMATNGNSASYQTIVDNWAGLPNWSAWGCTVQGHIYPYLGGAFGYRVDNWGYFIYFDYGSQTAKLVQVQDSNGVVNATAREV